MRLKKLLRRIALQRQELFPFPDTIEKYLEDFVPNLLLKSETLQQAFGVSDYEMEKLYEEAHAFYEADQYEEAHTLFRWLVLLDAYTARYWMGYAASQQVCEKYDQALHAYAVAALLESSAPYPHYYAAVCYRMQGEWGEASKALALAQERVSACEGKEYEALEREIEEERLRLQREEVGV